MPSAIEIDRLLKLRLVVARCGEMDLARWWNTQGQLGASGAKVIRRGFPHTHYFAQARSVFAVAAHRCVQIFDSPGCVTLWRLPEPVEEEFETRWEHWLDHATDWAPFFEKLAALRDPNLMTAMRGLVSVSEAELERYAKLCRSHEGRAVELPTRLAGTNEELALLALGFALGEPGAPAIPFSIRDTL